MKETVIQFGEGNFLRGFFDSFLDTMNKKGIYDGKAVVIQPRAGGKCALLNAQDCKYNLYLRGIEKGEVRSEHSLIESISRAVDPYKSYEEYISLADNEDFRFIISNTTEAGIAFDESCHFEAKPCLSFPGKLTQLLYRRYEKGLNGFIFLPTELIDKNGDELKHCILRYANFWKLEEGFINWIEKENVFSNTLVDRIVTGYPTDETAALHPDDKFLDTAEIFHLWVIEGNFENELPLQKAGFNVVWTDDATPYKKIKVRILNGAHTSIVTGALLSGVETVGECMEDETVSAFLDKCMNTEILPTIGDNEDSRQFMNSVFDRFRNPYIKHQLRSIALNCVSKFAVRVLPTTLEYNEQNGRYPECLSLSLAYLIYFYKNDEPTDAEDIIEKMKKGTLEEILSDESLWGKDISDMYETISSYYEKIEKLGARQVMKEQVNV